MTLPQNLLLIQLATSLFMTGLIWFVQIVHYPMFSEVGEESFESYERIHQERTTWVVMPVMLIELAATLAGLYWQPPNTASSWLWVLAGLLAVIWLSTALLQVPLHGQLEESYSKTTVEQLVWTNWLRTGAWTLRSAILIYMTPAIMKVIS